MPHQKRFDGFIRDSGAVEKADVFSLSGLLVIRVFSTQNNSQNQQEF